MRMREEKQRFFGALWAILLAMLVILTSVAVALAAPGDTTEDPANQLKHKLISVQSRIAGGQVEQGLKALLEIEQDAKEKLPARLAFITKLSEAVAARKSGKLAEAETCLRQLVSSAKETDQFEAALRAGVGLVGALHKSDKTGSATDLATFLSSGSARESVDFGARLHLARLWLACDQFPEAEKALRAASEAAKTRAQWGYFGHVASSLVSRMEPTADKVAAFGRLVSLAKSEESEAARAVLTGRLLGAACWGLRSWQAGKEVDRAEAILNAVRENAVGNEELARTVGMAEHIVLAHGLSGEGKSDAALKALQSAYELVKQSPADVKTLYHASAYFVRKYINAKDLVVAAKLVAFISGGPGQAAEPGSYHTNMARYRMVLGNPSEAEAELRRAAPHLKTTSEWEAWARNAQSVIGAAKTDEERIARLDRLIPLAKPDRAKEILLSGLLRRIRLDLSGNRVKQGLVTLDKVKRYAAGIPKLARTMKLLENMVSAHALSHAGDHAGALRALRAAYDLAKGKSEESSALFYQTRRIVDRLLAAKEKAAASWLADFMSTGPGEALGTWTLKSTMAQIYTSLGNFAKAEEALTETAAASKTEQQWNGWGSTALTLMLKMTTMKERTAFVARTLPLARSKEARAAGTRLAGQLLGIAGGQLSAWTGAKDVEDVTAVLDAVKSFADISRDLDHRRQVVQHMLEAHNLSREGKPDAALEALQKGYELAKEKPDELKPLYGLGTYLVRNSVKAKNQAAAVRLVHFLCTGPGKDHKPKQQADLVWSVITNETTTEMCLRIFEQLVPLVESAEAKEVLLGTFLTRVRRDLAQDWEGDTIERGIATFEVVKPAASELPKLAPSVALLDRMIAAMSLTEAGNTADALEALREAYRLAKGDPVAVADLNKEIQYLIRQRFKAKDKDAAAGLVGFLTEGPGREMKPAEFYATMAVYHIFLGDKAKQEDSIRRGALFNSTEQQWRTWYVRVHGLALRADSPEDALATLDRLAPLATSQMAKTALTFARIHLLLDLHRPTDAEALLNGPVAQAAEGGQVLDFLALRYNLAALHQMKERAGEYQRVLAEAETVAKAQPPTTRLYTVRAAGYRRLGRYEQAEAILLDELRKMPREDQLLRSYCTTAAEAGHVTECLRILAEIQAKPDSYLWLASTLTSLGKLEHAENALRKLDTDALSTNPILGKQVSDQWRRIAEARIAVTRRKVERCRYQAAYLERLAREAAAQGKERLSEFYLQRAKVYHQRQADLSR